MRGKIWLRGIVALLTLLVVLAACAGQSETVEVPVEVTRVVTETVVEEGQTVEITRIVTLSEEPSAEIPSAEDAITGSEPPALQATAQATSIAASEQAPQRLIIKDGRMVITVVDTETAVSRATQLVVESGGYIISQNTYDDDLGYKYATMRLAVPVDQFEFALRELRRLGEVIDESSSGTDVTDEYVDLNARLTNLQITRERLLEFLDEAGTIDEILEVNEELVKVEEEIAIIQGRIDSLRDRAAFSTIDLTLNPLLPTPTPSPTATATPLPTPESWRPGDTAGTAVVQLQNSAQNVADFTIFYGILLGPWLMLLLLSTWIMMRLRRWWQGRTSPTAPPDSTPTGPEGEGGVNDEA